MGLSQRLSFAAYCASMAVWAFVMVWFGLLIVFEWPERPTMGFPVWFLVLGGSLLIAAGEFVFALTASRMFPLASPRLTGSLEVLPFVGFLAVAIGVLFFWNQ
jgi:hypothetical protein